MRLQKFLRGYLCCFAIIAVAAMAVGLFLESAWAIDRDSLKNMRVSRPKIQGSTATKGINGGTTKRTLNASKVNRTPALSKSNARLNSLKSTRAKMSTLKSRPSNRARIEHKKGIVSNMSGVRRQTGNALKRRDSTAPRHVGIKASSFTSKMLSFRKKLQGPSVKKGATISGAGALKGTLKTPSLTSVESTLRK